MSCGAVLAKDSEHLTSSQVLDIRKTAALVGTHTTGPKRKRFKGAAEYLTHKKGCLYAAAIGSRRPVEQCSAATDLAAYYANGGT
jgi:hypothetical protein